MSRFEGSDDGTKPSTYARRYVYGILATTLSADLANESDWLFEGMDEFDQRRIKEAVKKVIAELRRKSHNDGHATAQTNGRTSR